MQPPSVVCPHSFFLLVLFSSFLAPFLAPFLVPPSSSRRVGWSRGSLLIPPRRPPPAFVLLFGRRPRGQVYLSCYTALLSLRSTHINIAALSERFIAAEVPAAGGTDHDRHGGTEDALRSRVGTLGLRSPCVFACSRTGREFLFVCYCMVWVCEYAYWFRFWFCCFYGVHELGSPVAHCFSFLVMYRLAIQGMLKCGKFV